MSYWDTSALVKLYAQEPDSAAFESHAGNTVGPLIVCRVGLYEARATFHRKEAAGSLKSGTAETLYAQLLQDVAAGEVRLSELDENLDRHYGMVIAQCYRQAPPLLLRTLDALHLAAAQLAGVKEVVATDKRMREAARLLGYALFPL